MARIYDGSPFDGDDEDLPPPATIGHSAARTLAAAVAALLVTLLVVSRSSSALGDGAASLGNVFRLGADTPAASAGAQPPGAPGVPSDPGAAPGGLSDPGGAPGVPSDPGGGGLQDFGGPSDPGGGLQDFGGPSDPGGGGPQGSGGAGEPTGPDRQEGTQGQPSGGSSPGRSGPSPAPVPSASPPQPPPTTNVELIDDDGGATLFDLPAMAPGEANQRCISVTYSGASPGSVALHATAEGELASHLRMTVEVGRNAGFGDCGDFAGDETLFDGTLAGFAARHGSQIDGLHAFSAASASESRTFRFTLTVDQDFEGAGAQASADFGWASTTS